MTPGMEEEEGGVRWEGLQAPGDVRRAMGDLAKAGLRLVQYRAIQEDARSGVHVSNAIDSVVLAMDALVAGDDIKCTLAQPPEDMNTRPRGPSGALITRCFHKPAHCWDGVGSRIDPCP